MCRSLPPPSPGVLGAVVRDGEVRAALDGVLAARARLCEMERAGGGVWEYVEQSLAKPPGA
jgi:hypothetical protein